MYQTCSQITKSESTAKKTIKPFLYTAITLSHKQKQIFSECKLHFINSAFVLLCFPVMFLRECGLPEFNLVTVQQESPAKIYYICSGQPHFTLMGLAFQVHFVFIELSRCMLGRWFCRGYCICLIFNFMSSHPRRSSTQDRTDTIWNDI